MAKAFRSLIGLTPSTASTKDSILLIIDAQNEYATGHLKTTNISTTRKAIANLLEKYRLAGAPIAHILHQVPAGAPVFTPGTDLAREFAELEPKAGEEGAGKKEKVIWKQQPGAFTGTGLDAFIKTTGRTKVVLTGYMAHVCVSSTARQAAERGYDVFVVEEAVGDRDIPGASAEEVVRMTLAELGDAFGSVVRVGDIE